VALFEKDVLAVTAIERCTFALDSAYFRSTNCYIYIFFSSVIRDLSPGAASMVCLPAMSVGSGLPLSFMRTSKRRNLCDTFSQSRVSAYDWSAERLIGQGEMISRAPR
jgi:hypothetical protein